MNAQIVNKGVVTKAPIDMKWIALGLLVFQNTALVLCMRYSLVVKTKYIISTAVAVMEVLKLVTCLLTVFFEANKSLSGVIQVLINFVL